MALMCLASREHGCGWPGPLLRPRQRLDQESSFMLLEPGERDAPPEVLACHLDQVARSANSVVIVAEAGSGLAGYVELAGGAFRRNRATAQVALGVAASGRGIGTGLLRQARDWAASHDLHRLELTVMAHNHRAIALYQRTGFLVAGRRSQCLQADGRFVDELYMAVLLPGSPIFIGKD